MDTVPVIWHLHFLQPRNFWRHARGIEIREIISVITGQYINHRQPHYRMCSGPVVEGSHGDFFLDLTCLTRLGKTRIGAEAASDSVRAAAAAPMSWAPSAQGLRQLVELFRATASANNSQHRQIQQQLSDFNAIPDYCLYLAYILNQLRTEEPHVRQMAGLQLKNTCKQMWKTLTPEMQQCVTRCRRSRACGP